MGNMSNKQKPANAVNAPLTFLRHPGINNIRNILESRNIRIQYHMLCHKIEYWEDRVNQSWWKYNVISIPSFITLLYFFIFIFSPVLSRKIWNDRNTLIMGVNWVYWFQLCPKENQSIFSFVCLLRAVTNAFPSNLDNWDWMGIWMFYCRNYLVELVFQLDLNLMTGPILLYSNTSSRFFIK